MKTKKQWDQSHQPFNQFINPGDEVDVDIYEYFWEVLPPYTYKNGLYQCSEPYNKDTYYTFGSDNNRYYYLGYLTKDEAKEFKKYSIRDHETGTVIDDFSTLAEAEKMLQLYVEDDKKDGVYTPRFYEIYDNLANEVVEISE